MNSQLHQTAAAVAACLGATMLDDGDSWRAFAETGDGIRLMFSHTATRGNKPGVYAYVVRQGSQGRETAKVGEIGVAFDKRAPESVARDIERRLLPDARIAAQNVRDNWAQLDSRAASLAAIAADLATVPGVSCSIEDRGQSIRGQFYEADTGYLHFEVMGNGSVSFSRLGLWGDGANVAALHRIIAAIRGGV